MIDNYAEKAREVRRLVRNATQSWDDLQELKAMLTATDALNVLDYMVNEELRGESL